MSLKKGFLQPKITLDVLSLDRKKLFLGILFWLILSFSIYSILYILRESFRHTSFWWNGEDFLVLTPTENYFYNFFFAFLACTFAFTAISNQWIRRSSTLRNIPRYKKAAIFHDKVSFSWYFIYWFSKIGIFFGVISCSMGAFSEFSLFPNYSSMFGLILINLFLHQWLKLRLIFKNSILPWMIGSFGAATLVAFVFASVNLADYKNLNESVLKNTITYHLSLDLPVLENGKERSSRKSLAINIYIGFSRQNSDTIPQIVVRDFHDPINNISMDMLEGFIKNERAKLDEYERDEIILRLNIDKHVKMKYVKELKNELSRNNARRIQYVCSDGQSNGVTSRLGISQFLRNPNINYSAFLTLEENQVVVPMKIRNNQIYFRNLLVRPQDVNDIARNIFSATGSNEVIELDVDNESTFEVYITVYDQLVGAVKNLRDEWALKNFNAHYSGLESYDSAQTHIDELAREQYPSNFTEKDYDSHGAPIKGANYE